MLRPARWILAGAALLLCLAGLGVWYTQTHLLSSSEHSGSVATKAWAEVAPGSGAEPRAYHPPQQIGTITATALAEVSGIAPSRTAPGLWWAHNDSGDQARLYVIDSGGKLLGSFTVTGAKNRDWEDLASGPGRDGGAALYLADIGDNDRARDDLVIYRVREPDLARGVISGATEPAEAFPFRYPDGRHDAEAMFVDPASGRIYLVTKTQRKACAVYRFPLPLRAGVRVTLEAVTGGAISELARLRLVTGAAAAPDGSRVVIRTYFSAVELARAADQPFEAIFDAEPRLVNIPIERQGEAITYALDGQSLITTSEKLPAPIYQIKVMSAP
jgi:hypothetical protein